MFTAPQLQSRMTAAIEDTKSVALDGGEIIELPIAQLTLSQAGEATVPIHATYLDEQVRRDLLQLASCLRCFSLNEVEAVAADHHVLVALHLCGANVAWLHLFAVLSG